MRIIVVLAVAALVALVIAVITGSAWPALAAVALAGTGIVLLVRDWRMARNVAAAPAEGEEPVSAAGADQV